MGSPDVPSWLSSYLATNSDGPPGRTLSLVSTVLSTLQTKTPASRSVADLQTFTSISGGQTVYVTVTQDSSATGPSQSSDLALSATENNTTSITGPVAGGVVGGVAVIGAAVLLLFLLRRRRQAKERTKATLPPPYVAGDMSEQLGGTTSDPSLVDAATAGSGSNEKATLRNEDTPDPDPDPDSVPQLDGAMVRPSTEIGGEPIGSIPELPATERNPFEPPLSEAHDSTEAEIKRRKSRSVGADNHVMSWAQYNSLGNRNPGSRLSQPPPGAPDASVWENMNPTSPTKSKKVDSETELETPEKNSEAGRAGPISPT